MPPRQDLNLNGLSSVASVDLVGLFTTLILSYLVPCGNSTAVPLSYGNGCDRIESGGSRWFT